MAMKLVAFVSMVIVMDVVDMYCIINHSYIAVIVEGSNLAVGSFIGNYHMVVIRMELHKITTVDYTSSFS